MKILLSFFSVVIKAVLPTWQLIPFLTKWLPNTFWWFNHKQPSYHWLLVGWDHSPISLPHPPSFPGRNLCFHYCNSHKIGKWELCINTSPFIFISRILYQKSSGIPVDSSRSELMQAHQQGRGAGDTSPGHFFCWKEPHKAFKLIFIFLGMHLHAV